MPQQINLCTPLLLTPRRYFTARTMAQALAAYLLLGGGLCGAWLWYLQRSNTALSQTLALQTRDLERLKAALLQSAQGSAGSDADLAQRLQEVQHKLVLQEAQLAAWEAGLYRPGMGFSDRLQWVAQTIPPTVWLNYLRLDGAQFEVRGFTLEPQAVNAWEQSAAASALMRELQLAQLQLKIESPAAPSSSPRPGSWSFTLVSAVPASATAAVPAGASTGGPRP